MLKDEILDLPDRFWRKVYLPDHDGYYEAAFFKRPKSVFFLFSGFFLFVRDGTKYITCTNEISIELSKEQATQLRDDLNRYLDGGWMT